MKMLLSSLLALALIPVDVISAQGRPAEPNNLASRVAQAQEIRLQRLQNEKAVAQEEARNAGRSQARETRAMDRELIAVWTALTPEVRSMPSARELTERLSRRPDWQNQDHSQRVASVAEFIQNYPAIRAARRQSAMDTAIETAATQYPQQPEAVARVSRVEPQPQLPEFHAAAEPHELAQTATVRELIPFPPTEVPDAFTINRRFNWANPHGQWMNQMLRDIEAAKQAGDIETYESLTKRYTTWAEQYLRRDR